MTKDEAIKYLKQLYPNGGHCWLDEQRIEAIDMAVKALQEEPASEDLITTAKAYADNITEKVGYKLQLRRAVCFGAQWQKEQLMAKAINTKASLMMSVPSICISLPLGVNIGDKVKVIVIKEE